MAWEAIITDFIPEAQTLLIVVEGVSFCTPEPRATYLSGA
jgi:hypothetical protein